MSDPMPMETVTKDPLASLTYGFDFGALGWLPEGETVGDGASGTTAPAWTITEESGTETGDDVALESDDEFLNETKTAALVRLIGGTDDLDYLVRCKITTTPSALVDVRTLRVRMRNR